MPAVSPDSHSPEIAFHRYFQTEYIRNRHTPDERPYRVVYPGKLDLSSIDADFAFVLDGVQQQINTRWAEQSGNISAPLGPVRLHLDYIAPPSDGSRHANAISFSHEGFAFVGFTLDILQRLFDICTTVSRSPAIARLLGLELPKREDRDRFLACLFLVQLQFVSSHELGHHFHGHQHPASGTDDLFEEFPPDHANAAGDKLALQAREVEADGYAVHMMLQNVYSGDSGAGLIRQLKPNGISDDKFILYFFLVAVGSFMYLKPQTIFDSTATRNQTHPFGLMRMNVVMTDLRGWAEQHCPALLPLTELTNFQEVMGIVAQCRFDPESLQSWAAMGDFLRSNEGERYRADLYAARERLRGEMKGKAWAI